MANSELPDDVTWDERPLRYAFRKKSFPRVALFLTLTVGLVSLGIFVFPRSEIIPEKIEKNLVSVLSVEAKALKPKKSAAYLRCQKWVQESARQGIRVGAATRFYCDQIRH